VIVILDRQHYGKPGKNDLGAGADLDGDGKVQDDEREANLTLVYIEAAKQMLEADGHTVHILDSGWYSSRHEQAAGIALANPDDKCAYIACHLNAGGGDYSVALYDHRSTGGHKLALSIAAAMASDITAVGRHLVKASSRTSGATRTTRSRASTPGRRTCPACASSPSSWTPKSTRST